MTNGEILQTFSDINHAYNNSTKYDTLKRMLDELTEPCGDCISRQALLEEIENGIKAGNYEEGYEEYPHINDMDDILECIKYADSVQPKPKTDVLDKIRSEIAMYEADCRLQGGTDECEKCNSNVFGSIYRIIDKYKAESEDKE